MRLSVVPSRRTGTALDPQVVERVWMGTFGVKNLDLD